MGRCHEWRLQVFCSWLSIWLTEFLYQVRRWKMLKLDSKFLTFSAIFINVLFPKPIWLDIAAIYRLFPWLLVLSRRRPESFNFFSLILRFLLRSIFRPTFRKQLDVGRHRRSKFFVFKSEWYQRKQRNKTAEKRFGLPRPWLCLNMKDFEERLCSKYQTMSGLAQMTTGPGHAGDSTKSRSLTPDSMA